MGMPPPYTTDTGDTYQDSLWNIKKPAFNPVRQNGTRVLGRNSMCPCGSRVKFKKCHGSTVNV